MPPLFLRLGLLFLFAIFYSLFRPRLERFGPARGIRLTFPPWLSAICHLPSAIFRPSLHHSNTPSSQLELWYCPKGTRVPPHIHERIDSYIIYLAGTMSVTVGHTTRKVCGFLRKRESSGRWILATRFIPAGTRHCAEVLGRFALFLNFERCYGECVSASRDFIPVD